MVNTVSNNDEGFTSSETKRDYSTYKSLGRLGNPTVYRFEEIVRANQIQNCPMTFKDITNKKCIVGNHL